MPRSYFTIGFLLSFLITTASLRWWQSDQYPLFVWQILGVFFVLALLFTFICLRVQCDASLCYVLIIILIGSGLAMVRIEQTTHVASPASIDFYANAEKVEIIGVIVEEPDRRPEKTKYTIEVDEVIDASGVSHPVFGRVLATDHRAWPQHSYGDRVRASGILERPGQIEAFSYDRYLSRYGIYSVMYRSVLMTISSGHGNRFLSALFDFKERFEYQINRMYPEPHASFMAGLLTGSRRGIPQHLLDDFQTTGLTHIIAISGYNITIVISIISTFLFFLPLKWRFFPSVFAIIIFTLFVGASPAVVRAAIMGILGLVALQYGRQTHVLIAILFTAALMVVFNPKVLWYDVGFQLSFLSVLGLVYLAPFLESAAKFFPNALGIRESLQMTMAAQFAAVPLTILIFGQFSLVAPLANIAVAPFIPLAMLFGFVGVIVSFVFLPLGLLLSFPGWACLQLVILFTRFFADIPYAKADAGNVHYAYVWLYYACIVCMIVISRKMMTSRVP